MVVVVLFMSGEQASLTKDDVDILCTAIGALVDSKVCTRDRKQRFVFRIGLRRIRLSEAGLLALVDKVSVLGGMGSQQEKVAEIALEAGLR